MPSMSTKSRSDTSAGQGPYRHWSILLEEPNSCTMLVYVVVSQRPVTYLSCLGSSHALTVVARALTVSLDGSDGTNLMVGEGFDRSGS